MQKTTLKNVINTLARVSVARANFLARVLVDSETSIEVSGTSKGFNYGETCEILLKIVLGLGNSKEQGKRADMRYNGIAYDIKAVDEYASASKGHNTDTETTLIIANYKGYQGVYEIANSEIVWTKSGKMQRAETLARAHLNKEITKKLLRA